MQVSCNQKFKVLVKTKGEQDEWDNNNCRNKKWDEINSTNYVVFRVYDVDFSIRQALISWNSDVEDLFPLADYRVANEQATW